MRAASWSSVLGLAASRGQSPERHRRDSLRAEPANDERLLLADLVIHDLERPRAIERLVEARDHAVALHAVEPAVAPLALLDRRRSERLL